MKFNKETDKIEDWHLLTKGEAIAYCDFLGCEKCRHEDAINDSEEGVEYLADIKTAWGKATRELEQSAIRRHKKDILEIDKLTVQIKHWFKLNNKEGKK